MHSTSIFLLAFGLLVTLAMARPGRRPGHGLGSHGQGPHGNHGGKWNTYRLPNEVRLPRLLAGRLGRPVPSFNAKKIFNGKYVLISPALLFKLKDVDNETDVSTTRPPRPTTEEPGFETTTIDIETTTEPIDIETTTEEIEIETTTDAIDEESTTTEIVDEESTTVVPDNEDTTAAPSFKKRSFSINNNEELFFLDD